MKYTLLILPLLLCLVAASCGSADGDKILNADWFDFKFEATDVDVLYGEPLANGWYNLVDSADGGVVLRLSDGSEYYLDPSPILTASDFETMTLTSFDIEDESNCVIVINLDDNSREAFAEATRQAVVKDMAFVVDNRLVMGPIRINAEIPSGILNIIPRKPLSKEEAEALMERIKADK